MTFFLLEPRRSQSYHFITKSRDSKFKLEKKRRGTVDRAGLIDALP